MAHMKTDINVRKAAVRRVQISAEAIALVRFIGLVR